MELKNNWHLDLVGIFSEDNYGGPQYNGGVSVISANHHQDHRGYVQSGHGHHGGRTSKGGGGVQYIQGGGGVQYNQGGGGVQYSQGGGGVQYTGGGVHFNPSGGRHGGGGVMLGGVNSGYQHGSMDSINTINSYNSNTLSFDSDLSVGKLVTYEGENGTDGLVTIFSLEVLELNVITDYHSSHQAVFRAGPSNQPSAKTRRV